MTLNNAVKNLPALTPQIIGYDEVVNIATDEGNIIIISEDSYKSLLLTAEVGANPKFKASLLEGLYAAPDDLVSENEVEW
jgi:PHD/YefM family antitoxin component YafN of YafNO toxin-antitoxin module